MHQKSCLITEVGCGDGEGGSYKMGDHCIVGFIGTNVLKGCPIQLKRGGDTTNP